MSAREREHSFDELDEIRARAAERLNRIERI